MSTVRIQIRRGTATEWTNADTALNASGGLVLAAGEMGVETNTRKIKIGDGSTRWSSLDYIASDSPAITEIAQDAIDQALSMSSGLTKSYNDNTNTISLGIDTSVIATNTYVDNAVGGLQNTVTSDYVLIADVGNAGGPAKLDADGNLLIPKSSIILEGSSADAYETTLTVTNPTADRTITFPNATGTVAVLTTDGDLVVPGNLTVSGDTTTLNTSELLVEDNEIVLNSNVSTGNPTLSAAVSVRRGSQNPAFLQWDETSDKWVANYGQANSKEIAVLDDLSTPETNANAYTDTLVSAHVGETTNVHGIANTANLAIAADVTTEIDDKIDQHNDSALNVHGIADTSLLATQSYVTTQIGVAETALESYADDAASNAVGSHSSDTTNIHGIDDTSALATKTYADNAVSTHEADTTNVHGIADTSALATKAYADNAVSQEAITTASNLGTAISNHNSDTTSVHGIADTTALALTSYVDTADEALQDAIDLKAPIASPTFTGTVSGVTKAMVGLGNVDNTADLDKPVSTATQTALDLKAPLASPTFTGTATTDDLVVNGDFTVNGTNFAASATTITIEDNMVQLAHQNAANTVDLGVVVAYNDGAAKHAGIVRDVSANKWKLFKGVTSEPSTTVDFTQGSLDDLEIANLIATDVTVSSGVTFADGEQTKQGVPSLTAISQKSSAYELSSLTERDTLIEVSAAAVITIPTDNSVDYPVGTSIDILQTGSGEVSIAGASGVTVNATPGLKLRTQWSSATLFKRATNSWVVYGDLKA
jgi:hypothetical protein